MQGSILSYLCGQPVIQILCSLTAAHPQGRHLRGLAGQYSLSPSGVADIVRRLSEAGVIKETRVANRRHLRLSIPEAELHTLKELFSTQEKIMLQDRVSRFSHRAAEKLEWMDQAYTFYSNIKRRSADPRRLVR